MLRIPDGALHWSQKQHSRLGWQFCASVTIQVPLGHFCRPVSHRRKLRVAAVQVVEQVVYQSKGQWINPWLLKYPQARYWTLSCPDTFIGVCLNFTKFLGKQKADWMWAMTLAMSLTTWESQNDEKKRPATHKLYFSGVGGELLVCHLHWLKGKELASHMKENSIILVHQYISGLLSSALHVLLALPRST